MAGCLFCSAPLRHTFVDLGMSPLCESYLTSEQLNQMEPFYPLHVYLCEQCFLVQVQEYVSPERIFTEYAYFSSYSDSWLAHAKAYADMIAVRLGLTSASLVIELGSNDGYLLQYFVARGIPVLGVEPARNVATAAMARGVPTVTKLFGRPTARELVTQGIQADLLCGANVLAQVPDVNDFVSGMKILLKPGGVITIEFPHLMRLIEENQFDTIYHEHFSYFSFMTAERIFAAHGLTLFDVEELPTHGGSLRIYARHAEDSSKRVSDRAARLRAREESAGFNRVGGYASFTEQVHETKRRLLEFLIGARRKGKRIAGYGAPGKGNTLLNYCGVRTDFLDYTVDRNPYKQGKFLPGTHVPIHAPEKIRETRPDYILILPWNLKDEIMEQVCYIRSWGGQFLVPIPDVKVYPVIFTETPLRGAFVIEPEPLEDPRGLFARTWCARELEAHGLDTRLAQCSTSFNKRKGTLRGMHYQGPPFAETKIIRCTRGALYDVIIDLRPDSATFTGHFAVVLSGDNRKMLHVPVGFAHGFQTLEDDTEVFYQISEFYSPDHARGVRWDDPVFGIRWPDDERTIAERDRSYPDFRPATLTAR